MMFHVVACRPTFSDDIIRQVILYLIRIQVLYFAYREIQKYPSGRVHACAIHNGEALKLAKPEVETG